MDSANILRAAIRDVPDFPKPGILFKDITPILSDGRLLRIAVDKYTAAAKAADVQKIVGVEARGFIFGSVVAERLGVGFVPIRKKGKLPWKTASVSYQLEYGEAEIEMHDDAIVPGERVALIDDLLATGGTACAAIQLLQNSGAVVAVAQFLVELGFLNGREKLAPVPVKSILYY